MSLVDCAEGLLDACSLEHRLVCCPEARCRHDVSSGEAVWDGEGYRAVGIHTVEPKVHKVVG